MSKARLHEAAQSGKSRAATNAELEAECERLFREGSSRAKTVPAAALPLLQHIRAYTPKGKEVVPRLPLEIPLLLHRQLEVVEIWEEHSGGKFAMSETVFGVVDLGLPLVRRRPEIAIISGAQEHLKLSGSPFVKMLEGTYVCAAREGRYTRYLRSVPLTLHDAVSKLAHRIGFSPTALYTLTMYEALVGFPFPGDACELMRAELDTFAKELRRRAALITDIRRMRR